MSKEAIKRAVDLAGSQTKLAAKLTDIMQLPPDKPITQQTVWAWLNSKGPLHPKYAIPIETAVDGEITRHELAPEFYPLDNEAA